MSRREDPEARPLSLPSHLLHQLPRLLYSARESEKHKCSLDVLRIEHGGLGMKHDALLIEL